MEWETLARHALRLCGNTNPSDHDVRVINEAIVQGIRCELESIQPCLDDPKAREFIHGRLLKYDPLRGLKEVAEKLDRSQKMAVLPMPHDGTGREV